MLIGRDMSRAAVSYSLAVRLASACFKILELAFLKHLNARWNMQSQVWFLSLDISLKRQIVNIQFGQHSIFHGYIRS